MRLTHVTIKNWRNFKQADFDLQDRMLVIGPNASGKSNLLDALRFLGQIASAGGGFQNAVNVGAAWRGSGALPPGTSTRAASR